MIKPFAAEPCSIKTLATKPSKITAKFSGGYFEFAFENYTALGYGDAVAGGGWRLIGPITGLNGLLLIGWSVAIIFEVMRLADIYVDPARKPSR